LSRFLCFAHRGASGHEPENTMAAFRRATEMGADFIELDVQLVEGELIVFHDDRLERTTNGKGTVRSKTLAQLRSLDAGKGERIPLLTEVLELLSGSIGINVELKGPGTALPAVRLLTSYASGLGWGRFLVSSFDRDALSQAARLEPELPIGVLTGSPSDEDLRFARSLKAFSLHPNHRRLTSRFLRQAQEEGLLVVPYTVNRIQDIERFRRWSADGVFTNYPERVLRRPEP
jgi:glycerophosphoryl diester phosphodiesterase